VDVLAGIIALQHLADGVVKIQVLIRDGEAHHLHGFAEAREVLGQAEGVELAIGLVPVRPDALEDVARVEDRRAVDGQDCLRLGDELAVHPDLEICHVAGILRSGCPSPTCPTPTRISGMGGSWEAGREVW
jgi:hypothetical protein